MTPPVLCGKGLVVDRKERWMRRSRVRFDEVAEKTKNHHHLAPKIIKKNQTTNALNRPRGRFSLVCWALLSRIYLTETGHFGLKSLMNVMLLLHLRRQTPLIPFIKSNILLLNSEHPFLIHVTS